MLLSAVIIILREVLEVALLTSVLLAVGKQLKLTSTWLAYASGAGLLGAFVYGVNTPTVSEWFDYTGQEVLNAISQVLIYVCIFAIVCIAHFKYRLLSNYIPALMALSVVLLITREGSEIYIYISGFGAKSEHLSAVVAGGVIGASIGLSVGALFYYLLSFRADALRYRLSMAMLAIIAAGILSQAIPMLMQADIIEAQQPLWDTTFLLPEQSLIGQLLYAVAGYEATPTTLHVISYVLGVTLIVLLTSGSSEFLSRSSEVYEHDQ